MDDIWTDDLKFKHEHDAGLTFDMNCPKCGNHIIVAQNPWWSTECECGLVWDLVLFAQSRKV